MTAAPLPPPPPPIGVLTAAPPGTPVSALGGALAGPPGTPPALPGRRRTRLRWRLLLAGFLVGLLLLAALVLGAAVARATGLLGFLVGLALALLPVAPVAAAFLWIDRYEPEPPRLLAFLFAWGAVVAALTAALVNSVTLEMLSATRGDSALATTAVLVAPVVEESAKGAGVLAVALARRREFDGVVDGVVSAGFVGLGFAFTENILYFGRAFLAGATQAGLGGGIFAAGAVFVLRGVLSPFAHPMFTVLTGIGLGLAVFARNPLRRLAPLLGLVGAVALHAWWNYAAVGGPGGFLISYTLFMVPLFVLIGGLAVTLRNREGKLIARRLPPYVAAGWLPAYDVAMVATLAGRRRALVWARSRLGAAGERAMRDYQRAAAELAFLRERAERLGPSGDFAEHERSLLAALARGRAALAPALAAPPRGR